MSSCWFERWCWLVVLLVVAVFGAIGGHAIQAKPTPHANEADFSAVVRNHFEVGGADLTYFKVDKIVDQDTANVTMMVGDYMASAAQFDITLDYGWRVRRVEPGLQCDASSKSRLAIRH